jgi:hypothetical protein
VLERFSLLQRKKELVGLGWAWGFFKKPRTGGYNKIKDPPNSGSVGEVL